LLRSGHRCRHVSAGSGTTPTFDGTVAAKRVVRRVLLADAGAPIANLCTGAAEQLGGGGQPAHPTGRERAEIGAINTEPDTEVLKFFMAAAFHAGHVVGAPVANLRACGARLKTMVHVGVGCLIVVMHNAPFMVILWGKELTARKRQTIKTRKRAKVNCGSVWACSPEELIVVQRVDPIIANDGNASGERRSSPWSLVVLTRGHLRETTSCPDTDILSMIDVYFLNTIRGAVRSPMLRTMSSHPAAPYSLSVVCIALLSVAISTTL